MNVYQIMRYALEPVGPWLRTGALWDQGTALGPRACAPVKQSAAPFGTDRVPGEAAAMGGLVTHLATATGLSLAATLRHYEHAPFSNMFSDKSPKWSAPSGSAISGSSVSLQGQAATPGLSGTEGDDTWAAHEHAPTLSRSPYVSGAFPCFGEYP